MIALARLSIRRPRAALAGWSLVALVLMLIGFGVSSTLSPSITVVPGTQSSRAQQLANARFGPSQLVPILLEGPRAALDRQGPGLVRALSKRPHTRVLSAWDAGTASAGLRPKPTAAMIVVSVDRSEKAAVQHDEPQIDGLVSHRISLVSAAALIPFATTDLINVRQYGVGVGVAIAILLDIVILRPVLLPAAEAVLGRLGWWPTRGATQPPPAPPATLGPELADVGRSKSQPQSAPLLTLPAPTGAQP